MWTTPFTFPFISTRLASVLRLGVCSCSISIVASTSQILSMGLSPAQNEAWALWLIFDLQCGPYLQTSHSQSVVPGPEASASPGHRLEMKFSGRAPGLQTQRRPSDSWWFSCTVKFGQHGHSHPLHLCSVEGKATKASGNNRNFIYHWF